MRAVIAGLALAIVAGHAWARAPAATPEAVAKARAAGDTLLQVARAGDVFVNETGVDGSATITLRHLASGFACWFTPGVAINGVVVYPGSARGDDVGCNTQVIDGASQTTNFTRDDHSDAVTIAAASEMLKRRFPAARPAPPVHIAVITRFPGVPTPSAARFVTDTSFEEVVSAHVRGWLVEDRFSAPLPLANSNILDGHWYRTVAEGVGRPRQPAETKQPAPLHMRPGSPIPPPPANDAASAALARREGARILASNGASASFDNITDSDVVRLRHKASGLVCGFDLGSANAILIGPGLWKIGGPDAVHCAASIAGVNNTLTLWPNHAGLTAPQALAGAVAATRASLPSVAPFTGSSIVLKGPTTDAIQSARLQSPPGAESHFVYLGAAIAHGWVVIDQAVAPADKALIANLVGQTILIGARRDIAKAPPAAASALR